MIDFCHIAPTPHLHLTEGHATHLVLAHLVEEDPEYAAFYKKSEGTIIMDNSAFEMYKRGEPMFPTERLLDCAQQVDADYVVMSDYPGESGSKTMKAAGSMIAELKEHGYGTFFCPQSEPGDIEDLMAGYAWAFSHPDIDYVAVSILNAPLAFNAESGNNLQRFLSRWKLMDMLGRRGFFEYDKKIHFLGMVDGPNEIKLVGEWHDVITTWDSSAAVWAGLNGIAFDNSPTGLMNGKFELEVDFNAKFEDTTIACSNMAYIDQLCGKV